MIIDFSEQTHASDLSTDVCIIGSGAAGITLALEFDRSGHDVILLAGGTTDHDRATRDLYQSSVVGLPHNGIHEGRARVHGGTTTLWAGQALPLDEIDFEPRDWVAHSGWPFRRDTLDRYYRRAERVMQLDDITYDEATWPKNRPRPPQFDPLVLKAQISQFGRQPNFALLYREELTRSENIRVLLGAHAVDLVQEKESKRLDRVEIRSLSGRSATIRPRFTVVCCGAIETARLLLSSSSVNPRGVGNEHDLVGRYFQEHLQGRGAVVASNRPKSLRHQFLPFSYMKRRYAPKLAASATLQRAEKIGNVTGDLCCETPPDSAIEAAKLLARAVRRKDLRPRVPHAIAHVARRPHEVVAAAWKYAVDHEPMTSKRGAIYLGFQAEQEPNPQSRITLGEERDALGLRRSVLDWRLTALDRHTLQVYVKTVANEFRRLGLAEIDASSFALPEDLTQMGKSVFDSNHHIGTTRMNDDPKQGVVDRDCRVHGIENLFVGSSAVFPTGGASNPTLTIIALCIRMADLLKRELALTPSLIET